MSTEEMHLKARPPPYTEGEVTTTSAVVYQAAPAPTAISVVVTKTMSPKPELMNCPSCGKEIVTRVEYKPTTKTHLFAVLLFIVFFPCVCLPYCLPSCRNADHYCPNCSAYLGTHKH